MMLVWFMCALMMGEPIPIKVDPGDPVPNIEVRSLANGETVTLRDVFHDGFSIFLTPSCEYCRTGMENVQRWKKEYDLVFVYVGDEAEIRTFIKTHGGNLGNSFIVEPESLVPWGLVTLPAVLTFNQGVCKVAMHGPLHEKNLGLLESFYMGARLQKRPIYNPGSN